MTETDKELEELLRQVMDDEPESVIEEETPESEDTDEEEGQEQTEETLPEVEEPEEPKTPEEIEETPEEPEETPELDPEALKSFVEDVEAAKAPTMKEQLQQTEVDLQKYQQSVNNFNPAANLPALNHNGKPIYELSDDEKDAYFTELQDAGKMTDFNRASNALNQYEQNLQLLEQAKGELQQKYNDYQQNVQVAEWFDVRDEIITKVPVLKEFQQQIENAIDQRLTNDAAFAHKVLTRSGKEWAIREVLKSEGVIDQLKKKLPGETASPSVPDATVKSKKVAPATTGKKVWKQSEIDRLVKTGQYAKYEDEIDQAALEGRIA